ncbi:serine/threonine-protein kinase 11-interacting protein [Diorhabda carinulata]|uniref:serine/threonine-protein kinase 11-interacting protein n=1 Tax=Diorhabda carinulata TaxID=1163345 RepID=UPI0025A16656|nr:serine/threonine-protein kinase 11-interacting protein [Diorhabda carinulata]
MEGDISHLANILRLPGRDVISGKGKLCLSANYLNKLNKAIDTINEEDVTSFQIVQTNNTKSNLIRDTQFLLDLISKTSSLKLIPDETKDYETVDLSRFKQIKILEIIKLDINIVTGLQKLRSQIQELTCCKSLKSISEVLQKCGGDNSQCFYWNELKVANFTHNDITSIDNSFERTLSLHTVDLSHNQLSKLDFTSVLPNLKHLNLSYNKLDTVPIFKGQIQNRLQVLVLNNNFIENIQGLTSLFNLQQLDLGYNCLLDHKTLLSVSHLVSLQSLNLQGNPLAFHPYHRQLSCNYLNKNAATVKFLLDGHILTKNEKILTGSLYPIAPKLQTSCSLNSLESSAASVQEKSRKVRYVNIEESDVVKENEPEFTPNTSSQHLEIKRQVEKLREEYGEAWLYQHSGLIVQDVLGLDKATILSSTPIEQVIPINTTQESDDISTFNEDSSTNENYRTAEMENSFHSPEPNEEVSDVSDGEDVVSVGESCMFLATNIGSKNTSMFVALTDCCISERDITTIKEKARWHINTIISCEKCVEENRIKIEFDTLRRDRKQRIYEFSSEDIETFYDNIKGKIDSVLNSKSKTDDCNLDYQCMKCSEIFQKSKSALLNTPSIKCPYCTSPMVVEKI